MNSIMINASLFPRCRNALLVCALLLTAGCTERLTENAFKADSGCKVKQYNVEWAGKNISSINWDGPCVNREANGYGKLTVELLNKKLETYEGRMRDGKFDTTQQRPDEKSVYAMGNKRLSGEFRAGRFLSGQIYVDDKLDFDGILYQPSRRYASGKSYFPDGSYIEGSFYDKEGNVSTSGAGVYEGIVYNEKNTPVSWIYQERSYETRELWLKEIAGQKAQIEAKAKRDAEIKTGIGKMLAQFDRLVQAKADTPEEQHQQALQRRDAAQGKTALLDKLLWQCRTSGCDSLEYLRTSRDSESKQLMTLKELVAKLPALEKPSVEKAVKAAAVKPETAVVKAPVKQAKPITLAKLQGSEEFVKGLQELRLLLKLKN